MSPPTIDGAFVAAQHPDVDTVDMGDEALVFDATGSIRLPLNATAALIWACLDGESTLGEISNDLAEGLGAPFERVLADVRRTVTGFVDRGVAYDSLRRPPSTIIDHAAPPRALDDAHFPLGEAGELSVRLGDDVISVRTNDSDFAELLRRALAPIKTSAPTTLPRLSLVTVPDRGRIAGMGFLHQNDVVVYRSAARSRLLRATLARIDAAAVSSSNSVLLDAHTLVGPRGAVLVGGWFREMLDLSERQLAGAGWRTRPVTTAIVDRTTFEVIVAPLGLTLDEDTLSDLDRRYPPDLHTEAREGRYPLQAILVAGSEPFPTALATSSQRLAGMMPLLTTTREQVSRSDVEWLLRLADHTQVHWIFGFDDQELLSVLFRLAGRAPRPSFSLPR